MVYGHQQRLPILLEPLGEVGAEDEMHATLRMGLTAEVAGWAVDVAAGLRDEA